MELPRERIRSIRKDDVVGEHEVRFTSEHEQLILRHEAGSRVLFAQGAIMLARRLLGQGPGLYGASDLLQINHP